VQLKQPGTRRADDLSKTRCFDVTSEPGPLMAVENILASARESGEVANWRRLQCRALLGIARLDSDAETTVSASLSPRTLQSLKADTLGSTVLIREPTVFACIDSTWLT
jgi:hypothetical protein